MYLLLLLVVEVEIISSFCYLIEMKLFEKDKFSQYSFGQNIVLNKNNHYNNIENQWY